MCAASILPFFARSLEAQAATAPQEMFTWGSNANGRTGLDIIEGHTLTPTKVGTSSNWTQVSAGWNHSLAINSLGELYAWGWNDNGRTGLGTSTGNTLIPTRVGTESNWTQVSAGGQHSLAINSLGELYAWGSNWSGVTGLGTADGDTLTPTRVGTASNWTYVAGSSHSLAINSSGELYTWGIDLSTEPIPCPEWYEEGGDVIRTYILTPTRVGTASNWTQVSAGWSHVLALQGLSTSPTPLTPGTLNKTLQMPKGTPLEVDPSFSFNFRATEREGTRPAAEVPTISPNPTITLNRSDAVTENGITTIVGSLDLFALLGNLNFPRSGYFSFEVSEVANSSGLHSLPRANMNYDSSVYILTVLVDRNGEVSSVTVQEKREDDSLGTKTDYLNFTNTFTVIWENGALEISKDVVGQYADITHYFTFDLELRANPLAALNLPITATVVSGQANTSREVVIDSYTTSFRLKHGERLVIEGLTVGTSFTVTERAEEEFAPSLRVLVSNTVIHSDSAALGSALSTGNHLIATGGINLVEFTNTHHHSPLTGLFITSLPFLFIALAAALLLVLAISLRSRRRIEQIEVV